MSSATRVVRALRLSKLGLTEAPMTSAEKVRAERPWWNPWARAAQPNDVENDGYFVDPELATVSRWWMR